MVGPYWLFCNEDRVGYSNVHEPSIRRLYSSLSVRILQICYHGGYSPRTLRNILNRLGFESESQLLFRILLP